MCSFSRYFRGAKMNNGDYPNLLVSLKRGGRDLEAISTWKLSICTEAKVATGGDLWYNSRTQFELCLRSFRQPHRMKRDEKISKNPCRQ